MEVGLRLTDNDQSMLDGNYGEAVGFAMNVVVQMAKIVDAPELLSIEQAHIDACALMAQSNLDFVERLLAMGARVRVPTTLSMVSLDLERWSTLGVPEVYAKQALRIADAYSHFGCVPTWTCAPYQGYLTPRFGQHVAWGESNAVAYANSVLGARTNRYPDYLDLCAAITGRVPYSGLHQTANRRPSLRILVEPTGADSWASPTSWAVLGAWIGSQAGDRIPLIEGLAAAPHTNDNLKAMAASAASFGAVYLFHLDGITPEASCGSDASAWYPAEEIRIGTAELRKTWRQMSSVTSGTPVDAVLLGCPHLSYLEIEQLAMDIQKLGGARASANIQVLAFVSASTHELARRGGLIDTLERFGVTFVRDTCPFHSPVVAEDARCIATDSGKCAYYASGELGVHVAFTNRSLCLQSAISGVFRGQECPW